MSVSLSIPFNSLLSSSFSLHPLLQSRLDFPSFTAGNLYRNEAKTRLCPTHDDRIRPTLWSTCRRTWHRTQAGVSLLNNIIAEILPVPKVRYWVFKMWKGKTWILHQMFSYWNLCKFVIVEKHVMLTTTARLDRLGDWCSIPGNDCFCW